jgi:tetratricopeptide (TPR) repeat protein
MLVPLVSAFDPEGKSSLESTEVRKNSEHIRVASLESTYAPESGEDVTALLQEAESLMVKREYKKLLDLAARIVEKSPGNSEGYRYRGNARRNLNDLKGAKDDYAQAIERAPKNERAWNGLAQIKRQEGDLKGAMADINHSLEIDPDYAAGRDSRATIYHELKDYRKSIIDSSRAIELAPGNPLFILRRGLAREELKDFNGAMADFNAVLSKTPNDGFALNGRGNVLTALKRHDEAIQDYSRALQNEHSPVYTLIQRGKAYMAKGMNAQATRDFEQALQKNPKNMEAAKLLASLRTAVGERDTAERVTSSREDGKRQETAAKIPPPDQASATAKSGNGQGFPFQPPNLPTPQGELWEKAGANLVTLSANNAPLKLSAGDPANASGAIPLAGIITAMEGLQSMAGPLNEKQKKSWGKKWQPFFDYPDPEAIKYFDKLNPLLLELQSVRGVVNQAALDFDGAWAEAAICHAVGDTEGAQSALDQAELHSQALKSANARMGEIQKKVQALGNPPNPLEAKAKAKAWSRKWGGLARIAYLWRIQQLDLINFEGAFAANMPETINLGEDWDKKKSPAKPAYKNIYLADLETWSSWFNGGEHGPEPLGSNPPPEELLKDARKMRIKWYQPDVIKWIGANYLLRCKPREPAEAILAGKMVVPKGPLADELARTVPKGPMNEAIWTKPYMPVQDVAAKQPPPAPVAPVIDPPVDEEKKAKLDAIAEKEDLIKMIKQNLAKDEAEWSNERDPKRKDELYRRVLNNRSAVQQEMDLIQSLKTGVNVHTRTPSDDYCHDLMIVKSMEEIARFEEARRMATAAERMRTKLELMAFEGGDPKLSEFVGRQITTKDVAEGNMEKIKEATKAVYDTLQGRREQEAAKSLEESIQYEDYEQRASRVRNIAGLTMMVTGIAAPMYAAGAGTALSVGGTSTEALTTLNVVYGVTTGTIEGGPVEGVKQAIAMTGMAGMVAGEMMTGYQRGGLVSSGGVAGAVERGAEAFFAGKLVEAFAAKAGAWWSQKAANPGAPSPLPVTRPGMTVAELAESQAFQSAKRQATQKIKDYETTMQQIKKTSANSVERAELEAKRLQQATHINDDFYAKRIIKNQGKAARAGKGDPGHGELEKDFANSIETINRTQVDPAFRKSVKDAGYVWKKKSPGGEWKDAGDLKFKEFRQGAAGKTANTDRDQGLDEMKNSAGEIVQLFKGGKPVKLTDAEKDLQSLFDKAYNAATGGNSKAAMQNVTTSGHREAYKDLTYTQLNNPDNLARVNKGWAAQSAEVLADKVLHAGPGTGEFAGLFKKIDGANQAAKDIEQRLLPFLKGNQAKSTGKKAFELGQDMDKWQAISKALQNVEKDPVAASRQLRVLTGLDSIGEVSELVSKRFLGSVMQH